MDSSGRIRHLEEGEEPAPNEIRLEDAEAKKLSKKSPRRRKNWMKNKPCPCNSGKKFKNCCWAKFARHGKE